jgi:uroporphyrinogen-III decarboxylase
MRTINMNEHMMNVYRNQTTDIMPIGIYSRYLPRGSAEREIRAKGFGIIDYHPVVSLLAPPWHMYSGFISEVKGAEMSVAYRWDGDVKTERRIYRTPVGELWQDVSKSVGAGSEFIAGYFIKSPEDYKVMQYLVENTVFRRNEEEIRLRKRDLGADGVVLGRMDRSPYQKLLIELAGAERFLMDLYTDPEVVLELMDAMNRRMDEMFELALESEVEILWQPDNITFDMTPPDNYEAYCLPFYRRHGTASIAAGKPYLVHIDGKLRKLETLIQQTPFSGIESMSLPQINGDYSLREAMLTFPDKVILPNFPANLSNEGDETIRAFMRDLLRQALPGRPFMLQVSEDIPVGNWPRVLALLSEFVDMQRTG